MTNEDVRDGATLIVDDKGEFIKEPDKDCKHCSGSGTVRTVNKQNYSTLVRLRKSGAPSEKWEQFLIPVQCSCVRIWLKASIYDKIYPTLG